MSKKFKLVLLTVSLLIFSGCTVPSFVKKKAGLEVSAANDERALLYLDGLSVGQTPFSSEEMKPGSYTLRLVPEDSSKEEYETKITLNPGLLTVVNWSFGITTDESGGEIIELSKLSGKKIELSVVTDPDNIIIKVDGQSKGFSPLILNDIAEGSHTLTVTAPGYVERTSNPKLIAGYRLIVNTKLAREPSTESLKDDSATPSATPTPEPDDNSPQKTQATPTPKPTSTPIASESGIVHTPDLPYVEIAETGTNWLRVRAEANASSEELAKLTVGSKVPYLDETISGWHKVEYQTGKEGWVSGQYAIVHR